MLSKRKYVILILSIDAFLCSAEEKCEILRILTGESHAEKTEDKEKSINEILTEDENIIGNSENQKTKKRAQESSKTLKDLLDIGIEQANANVNDEKTKEDENKNANLKLLGSLIREIEKSAYFPAILKPIMNIKGIIDTYKNDEDFAKLSSVGQMKLVLMLWCLKSEINSDILKNTIEEFSATITYSNIKTKLNEKIDNLIKEEIGKIESGNNIEEKDHNDIKKYSEFKIDENDKIKPLFYYFIKNCIFTSIALLVHRYCNLCKEKFGTVFIGENEDKMEEYVYTTNTGLFDTSDKNDTLIKNKKLFSSNPKYTRVCNMSFEDITRLIELITELPNFSDFLNQFNKVKVETSKLNVDAFKKYKGLLDFVKQKEEEIKSKKNFDIKSVHIYDIRKFFDMKIKLNEDDNKQDKNENFSDLEFILANTFGELVNKAYEKINEVSENIKNITFLFTPSKYRVINLSFKNCKFINNDIDITDLIQKEKNIEINNDSSEEDDYSY